MQISLQQLFENYLNKKSIFVNKEALTIKYTPYDIPHRDKEINLCAQILAPSLRMERPSNLFIYGKTGTGKTVTIKHVCNELEKVAQDKKIPLKVIYLNCKMRKVADTEYRLVAQLAREMGVDVPSTGLPTDEVYNLFYNAIDNEMIILIILDEIDQLIKKTGDEILYNLTRINSELKKAQISIIGISNDVTFKSNLDPRVKSSLNEEEIIFPPYDALQLKDILDSRSKVAFVNGAVNDSVIAKCAAFAAREHGDARKALDLLRVAGELAERENCETILERHIDEADEKIETDQVIELIKGLPKQSLTVLYSILSMDKIGSEDSENHTGLVYNIYKNICLKAGLKNLTQRRVSDLINELDMMGVISTKVVSKGRYGRTKIIELNINKETNEKLSKIIEENLNI